MVRIVQENRNIVQHSVPAIPLEPGDDQKLIFKLNRIGKPMLYEASEDNLLDALSSIEEARGYAIDITGILIARLEHSGFEKSGAPRRMDANTRQWLEIMEKPPLPARLTQSSLKSVVFVKSEQWEG
jgi:hypothetical protein